MTRDIGDPEKPASRKYLVRIRTGNGEYEGVLYSAFPAKRLSDVLAQMEGFLNLKDARDMESKEKYPFMVISKGHIETIKVLDER